MKAVIDINRGSGADKARAKWMLDRGMFHEGRPYEVIGDTADKYIDRFLILRDERGQASALHSSILVPFREWIAEKREENICQLGIF